MINNHTGHSAEVEIHVVADNGSKFEVVQLGPDFLVLENAHDIRGSAEIVLSVDGVTRSRHVQLQRGSGDGHIGMVSSRR